MHERIQNVVFLSSCGIESGNWSEMDRNTSNQNVKNKSTNV